MSLSEVSRRCSLLLTHGRQNAFYRCLWFSSSGGGSPHEQSPDEAETLRQPNTPVEEESALSRRFTAMAEDALVASPRRASKIAEENEFSEDLKRELEARIASADFKSTHASAIATSSLPSYAPKHTRDLASAPAWTGSETTEDGVLRMLVDAHRPLRGGLARKRKSAGPVTPANIDLRPQRTFQPNSTGRRIASAREKTEEYTLNKTAGLTDEERTEMRRIFRERFQPSGRAVVSFQALASLADEKIEEARRRGMFDNLSNRGKPLERDHNAESPFLDTTEYLLNRIIKQQDIVPPWIEKQQELANKVRDFRERLRVEWRRHVARSIASAGGDLESQCRKAEKYAQGEARLTRLEERAKKIELGEEIEEDTAVISGGPTEVFRDPTWEATELTYHKLVIETLNSTARSYNLMAPELAKKPYYNLDRELKKCFRDCAPMISREIRDRATRPTSTKSAVAKGGGAPGGILEGLIGEKAVVYDSMKPNYGFREFWGDVWGKRKTS